MSKTTPSHRASVRKGKAKTIPLERKRHMSMTFLGTVTMGLLLITASFGLGLQSSAKIKTLPESQANGMAASLLGNATGDFNGDGSLTNADVVGILESVQGLRVPTRQEILLGDSNRNYRLDVNDALFVLHKISEL